LGALPVPPAKARSGASDDRAGRDHRGLRDRDYIHPARWDPRVRDYSRPDCSRRDWEARQDLSLTAVPGERDRYKWDDRESGSLDASACRDAAEGGRQAPTDGYLASPPYRGAAARRVLPEAGRQDSASPADVTAATETIALKARLAGSSAGAKAQVCSASWGRTAGERPEPRCREQQFQEELSEHRPRQAEEAVAVPIKSDRGVAQGRALRESPSPWKSDWKEPGSRVGQAPQAASAYELAGGPVPSHAAELDDAELDVPAPHGESASTVARNSARSTKEAARAERGVRAVREHLPQSLFPGIL
jgi:hypothetical protein